jgi:phosphoglycerate kinase
MAKLTVRDLDVRGKRVFLRVDYNVPLEEKDGQMVITDATRIVATLPTLKLLIEKGGKLILTAHLGRPKGKRDATMSLKPVATRLSELLGKPVAFVDDCIGEKIEQAVARMKDGDVVLLENVRYYNEEEKNDPAFAEKLAKVADVYVNDAFGAAHRAHASTEGVATHRRQTRRQVRGRPAHGARIEISRRRVGKPARPFVVILGGAKVSDKIKVIDRLLEKADTILIGGAMAYTFRLAQGFKTGKSLVEPDATGTAKSALAKAKAKNVKFLLPVDDVVATPFKTDKLDKKGKPVIEWQNPRVSSDMNCPDDAAGLDIGPATVKAYSAEVIRHGEDDFVERPDGFVRKQTIRRRHQRRGAGRGRRHAEERRQEHHRRRRQREGAQQGEARRQGDIHEHRRRREPGISGRRGAARRGGAFGQINFVSNPRSRIERLHWKRFTFCGATIY